MSDCCLTPTEQFFSYIMAFFSMRWWWGPVSTGPTCLLGIYSASSLKQQSADRHVVPVRHIILISSQPVFALSPLCCILRGEATNTYFLVFGLTQPGSKPRSTTLQTSTLTIISLMQFIIILWYLGQTRWTVS